MSQVNGVVVSVIKPDNNKKFNREIAVTSNVPMTREVQFGFTVSALMRELLTIPIDTLVFKYMFIMDTEVGMTLIYHPEKQKREVVTAIELVEHTLNFFRIAIPTSTSYDVNRTFSGKLVYLKARYGDEKMSLLTNINQIFI